MANFRNLQHFIERENRFAKLFNKDPLPMDPRKLTDKQADDLFQKIDADLSPENLHCDGEISAAQARKKKQFLEAVARELSQAGFAPIRNTYCL